MIENPRAAWRVVFISAFAVFIIFGIRLSFSVFFAEFISREGWSSESAAGIFSVSMLVFALGSTPAGVLLDRYGPRLIFSGGALLLAVGLLLSSQAQTIEALMITYGVIAGLGISVLGLGQVGANIAEWIPPRRRGTAIGVAFAGSGMGSLLFVPFTNWLIDLFGWRQAYLAQAMICLFVLTPLLIFGMSQPSRIQNKETSERFSGKGHFLFHNGWFWVMLLISFNALGPLRSLTVHQIAYMESVGVERDTASAFVGFAGFLTAWTFIGWGYVSDRFGRTWAFSLGGLCLIGSVGVLLLMQNWTSPVFLVAYSVLLALGEGTRSSQPTAVASDLFQKSGLGLVNGLVGAMFGLGAAFGPWLVGRLHDQTGSYFIGLMSVVVMVSISMIAFIVLMRPRSLKSDKLQSLAS